MMRLESCRPRPTESKVWFRFVPREGWFPQNTEGLWAVKISDDTARVTSVAFLQNGVAETAFEICVDRGRGGVLASAGEW